MKTLTQEPTELRQWYDDVYWSDRQSLARRPLSAYEVFLNYLHPRPGASLLDVGCGEGSFLQVAHQKGLSVSGVDFSEKACALSRKRVPQADVIQSRGESLPFESGRFDFVASLGSLEHFDDIPLGLQEMMRVAKPTARFCILVPNSFYLFDIIQVWKKGSCRNGTWQPQETLATLGSWKDILEKQGLKTVAVYRDKEPINTSWRHLFCDYKPHRILNRLMEKGLQAWMPLAMGYQFAFICEKARP